MNESQTIVVGGGLAGLSAAATLARSGHAVTVLEGAEHVGGRARSRHRDGFDLNLGPHALYRAGGGLAALRHLGVRPTGRMPRADRAGVWRSGEIVPAFGEFRRTVKGRSRLLRAAIGRRPAAADDLAGTPADDWIDHITNGDSAGRTFLSSLVRTVTYTGDHALLDAGAAVRQLRASTHGVLYLDGGWSSLVDALVAVVRASGGDIRTRSTVAAIEYDETRVRAVRMTDGTTVAADAAVVAVSEPRKVPRLLDGPLPLTIPAATDDTVPVRMAHLDLALRPLESRRFPNVLGLDEPVFMSVTSHVAKVAPTDGAVVTIGRYLRPGEEDTNHRPSLERVLDAWQSGWRDDVVDVRYVPRSLVAGDHPRWATNGTANRLAVDAVGVRGLALAGDWIGPIGMLADAAILSGCAAGDMIVRDMTRTTASAMA